MVKKTHVCPVCGKKFTTKEGLKQHEFDKHNESRKDQMVVEVQQPRRRRRRRTRQQKEQFDGQPISFNPTGAAELIPRGNPSGIRERPKYGPSLESDRCHRFIMACRKMGCSMAGAIYALKNIHPNCDNLVAFQGIPDESSGRIFPLEVRSIIEINSGGSTLYDTALISRWAPNQTALSVSKNTNATSWGSWVVKSSSLGAAAVAEILRFRVGYGGMTCYLSASANQTQGMVYSANRVPEVSAQINTTIQNTSSDKIIREISGKWDSSSMFAGDPGFYANQAYKGVYGRMLPSNSTRKWINTNDGTNTAIDSWIAQTPDGAEKPMSEVPDVGNFEMPDMSNVYALFEGIDPKAKVIVKTRVGFEVIVKPTSLASYGLTYSPDYDPIAMELTGALLKGLPSGVPSEDNDLGTVLDTATNVLFDALAAAPHPVARGIGMVGNLIKSLFK